MKSLLLLTSSSLSFPLSFPFHLQKKPKKVSSPYCAETVESSDCYLFAGPVTNDYTSVGYSLLLKPEKMIVVDGDRVSVAGKRFFSCIAMDAFLERLAERVEFNDAAWKVCWYFLLTFLKQFSFSCRRIFLSLSL